MPTDAQLDTLEAKGLIRLAALQPELEYLFRHALVQDAAYESLLKQERRGLHHTVGEALETLYPERRGELASMLGMHFEQAGEGERAIPYLVDAAKYAYDRNAIVESFALYGRASALLPAATPSDTPERRRRRIEIEFGRVKAGFTFLSDDEQIALLDPLIEQVEALGDLRLTADVYLQVAFIRQFRGERPDNSPLVRTALARVTEIAKQLNDPYIEALPKALMGLFQVFTGNMEAGVKSLREAAPMLEASHAYVISSFSLVALAIGLSRLGRFDEASAAAASASKLAESGDIVAKLDALIGESFVHSARGDLDEAIPLAKRCTAMSEETGATACIVASNFVLGDAYMRQGKYQSAQIAFERSNEVAETFEERSFRPSLLAYMRANAASMGQFDALDSSGFDDALRIAREASDRFGEANILWKRAEWESARTDASRDAWQADFTSAVGLFEDMHARPFLARTLRGWGLAQRAAGDAADGNEKLRRAVELFDEMGITREADELRATLASGDGAPT
jgi:tetratricopeptide (TPR) repeat protein